MSSHLKCLTTPYGHQQMEQSFMKKILIGFLAVLFVAVGLPKIADMLDASIKGNSAESERSIAANGRPSSSSEKPGTKS